MNLVIDIGNTRSKYAFFAGNEFVEAKYTADDLFNDIESWKKQGERIDVLFSGSGALEPEVLAALENVSDFCYKASALMPLPIKIRYNTLSTLGFDRIAICAGAVSLYPGQPLLVIDTGTALTYNFVDAEGTFLGGNISPGIEIRFRGLHEFTEKLPYIRPSHILTGIGQSTEEAILNGVLNGILFEIRCYIDDFLAGNKRGKIVLTGGSASFLDELLNVNVECCKTLNFIGLNEILLYLKKAIGY